MFLETLFWVAVFLLAMLIALFMFYRFCFLRKPGREVPRGDVVVSPADGRIVRIVEFSSGKPLNVRKGLLGRCRLLIGDVAKEGYLIVIMMTPLDVHYQRSPIGGEILSVSYRKGLFLNAIAGARSMLASVENERNEILIGSSRLRVKVVQVAGLLARRIRCFVRPKQKIHKGEELGLICLGSQVLLVIPKLGLEVREGQKVIDGETVIARF
jgi:phosphatidylserine decarboxylase